MREYDINYHKKLIDMQLSNSKDAEEEIEKTYTIIRDNLFKLFYESNMSIREFAMLAEVSPATIKRALAPNDENAKINFNSLMKVATYLDYPIECMLSDLSPEDIEHVKKFNGLNSIQKDKINKEMERLLKYNAAINNVKGKKHKDEIPNQISMFDILNSMEDESKKEVE